MKRPGNVGAHVFVGLLFAVGIATIAMGASTDNQHATSVGILTVCTGNLVAYRWIP